MDTLAQPTIGRLQGLSASAGGITVSGVRRNGTRLARILEIDGPGRAAAPAAAAFVEEAAAAGCTIVRAELATGDPAAEALSAVGFQAVDPAVHAALPPRPVLRLEHRTGRRPPRTLPYYGQSTGFTCGAVALMLARRRLRPDAPVDRRTEIALWRRATTVQAPAGPGGCDPFGVACAAAGMGLSTRLVTGTEGPVANPQAYTAAQFDLISFVQAGFREEARDRGIGVEIRAWTHDDLATTLTAGGVAIVLIDQTIFHDEAIPHWVLVHGHAAEPGGDGCYAVDDPWVEPDDLETDTDRFDLPVPAADLDRMAWWGQARFRSAVLIGAGVGPGPGGS